MSPGPVYQDILDLSAKKKEIDRENSTTADSRSSALSFDGKETVQEPVTKLKDEE